MLDGKKVGTEREEYIKKFCGLRIFSHNIKHDLRCNIEMGPLEERCTTCGLLINTGWLTEFLDQQNKRIEKLERKVKEITEDDWK